MGKTKSPQTSKADALQGLLATAESLGRISRRLVDSSGETRDRQTDQGNPGSTQVGGPGLNKQQFTRQIGLETVRCHRVDFRSDTDPGSDVEARSWRNRGRQASNREKPRNLE